MIPLQTKLDFLENVVILSFGNPSGTRNDWIVAEIDILFPNLSPAVKDRLILLSNTIQTLGEAKERLREGKFLFQQGSRNYFVVKKNDFL
jgi:hypothetical protein